MIVRVSFFEPRTGLEFINLVDDRSGEILDYPGVCWSESRFGPAGSPGRAAALAAVCARE